MITKETKEAILCNVLLKDVVKDAGVELKRHSTNKLVGCCPFHQERTPSFVVDTRTNKYVCYGCGEHGDVIDFVCKSNNLSFTEAVKALGVRYNIPVEDTYNETPEQRRKRMHREELANANNVALRYFIECFGADDPDATGARAYAHNRWGKEYCAEAQIGYAPKKSGLLLYCKSQGIQESVLEEIGLIKLSQDGHGYYDFYRNRVMIPIMTDSRTVIGFTARALDADSKAKYLNSSESDIYKKSKSLFGLDTAIREARLTGKMYLSEGAPDAMRLKIIGVPNSVAPLGTAMGADHFALLHKYASRLCFLPDADTPKSGERYGTGVKKVMQNGAEAIRQGFEVLVKQIPVGESKSDPDTYFTTRKIFDGIEEEEFIVWYANNAFNGVNAPDERRQIVKEIAALLAAVGSKPLQEEIIAQLSEIEGTRKLWQQALNRAKYEKESKGMAAGSDEKVDELRNRGFFIRNNAYWSITEEGDHVQWSNFVLKPLYHIKDAVNPRRLFEIMGQNGQKEIVELKPDELVQANKFKQKLESIGNYIWYVGGEKLTKLKSYLYDITRTASEIKRMGWQRQGFYAFGNGCFENKWVEADEMGIVNLNSGNYYLPSASTIFKEEDTFFTFERNFSHLGNGNLSVREYTTGIKEVFGNNGSVAFCFYIATLFHDIIFKDLSHFPILNVFGQKGSGKSLFCQCIMSLFVNNPEACNITHATVPALAQQVAQVANGIVHIDEYRNDILPDKIEFIKGLWDGYGRTRMNMDRDKRIEKTRVDSGIMLSGQQMPTADIAMFSRMVFICFNTTTFSPEEDARMKKFRRKYEFGCSHITLEVLKLRNRFEIKWKDSLATVTQDFEKLTADKEIESRIANNWIECLAAFHAISDMLDTAFNYKELLNIFVRGAEEQNSKLSQSNELSDFWNFVSFLMQDGKLYEGADFKIQNVDHIRQTNRKTIVYPEAKRVLFLRFNRVQMLFARESKGEGKVIGISLKHYLENSPVYLGKCYKKMDVIGPHGPVTEYKKEVGEAAQISKTVSTETCHCFDYDKIREMYDISLSTSKMNVYGSDDEDIDD